MGGVSCVWGVVTTQGSSILVDMYKNVEWRAVVKSGVAAGVKTWHEKLESVVNIQSSYNTILITIC